nr:hypothetical protein [Rhabdothermincola sediminis]
MSRPAASAPESSRVHSLPASGASHLEHRRGEVHAERCLTLSQAGGVECGLPRSAAHVEDAVGGADARRFQERLAVARVERSGDGSARLARAR